MAGPVDQAAVRALFPPDATLEFKAVRFSYRELIDRANALNAQITPDRHLGPAYLGRGRVGPDAMLNGLDVGMGDNADAARDCAFRLFVGDIPVSIRHGITDKIAQPLN